MRLERFTEILYRIISDAHIRWKTRNAKSNENCKQKGNALLHGRATLLECGGKRSATPLWIVRRFAFRLESVKTASRRSSEPKRRRRFALPAHSIRPQRGLLPIVSPPTPAPIGSVSPCRSRRRL